jgi:hypothetical protein
MRRMGVWAALALCGSAAAGEEALFNGKDLSGWTKMNGGEYAVANGVLTLDKGNGWLRSDRAFADFDLTVEWRADPQYAGGKLYDSGLFFRTPIDGSPWPPKKFQFNMKHGVGGDLSGIVKNGRPELLKPAGEWNVYRLKCVGKNATAWINGTEAWTTDRIAAPQGHLGLQAEGFRLEFRKIVMTAVE